MTVNNPKLGQGPGRIVETSAAQVKTRAAPVNLIVLATDDNVGIALRDIEAREVARTAEGYEIVAAEQIPLGHKLALRAISAGETIVRFGVPVAIATTAIERGQLVHVHNVRSQYLDNVEDHYE